MFIIIINQLQEIAKAGEFELPGETAHSYKISKKKSKKNPSNNLFFSLIKGEVYEVCLLINGFSDIVNRNACFCRCPHVASFGG
ncbi:MAG: hypothetical protein Kow0037_32240 [Calditrichia bacterium]